MAKDPVCGMEVDEEDVAGKTMFKGVTYFFCALVCKEKFESTPDRYIASQYSNYEEGESMLKDPVCGMDVDPATAAGSHVHADQTYYFCNLHCL